MMAMVEVHVTVPVTCCCDHKKQQLDWNVGPVSEQNIPGPIGARYMLQLTDTQQVKISVSPVDKKGAPAPVASVTFSSSDANVASVTQDTADPSSALVVAGQPGAAQIKAVADVGDGTSLEGVLDITVVGGKAVSLSLNAGSVEEQPA